MRFPTVRQDFEVDLELTNAEPPRFTILRQNTKHMDQCGTLNVHALERKFDLPSDLPDYRRRFRDFILRQVACHLGKDFVVSFYSTTPESKERRLLFDPLEPLTRMYLCDQKDALIRHMQEILGGTIYFRCSQKEPQQNLQFMLAYEDGRRVPFDEWSDGQKFNFYAGTLLALAEPEIVLIDEIENHLHPAYITRLLEMLREKPRQSILVTHHPHVIFSELSDAVFYMEQFGAGLSEPPSELRYEKLRDNLAPKRRIVSLEDQFDKISHTYRLFDNHDNQLMRLAVQLEDEAELVLCRALTGLFSYPPVQESRKKLPDTQAFQLLQRIRDLVGATRDRVVTLLDCGAGLGRLAHELEKVPQVHEGALEWLFWEPNTAYRLKLQDSLKTTHLRYRVLEALNGALSNSVDLCLLCNVLHELTIDEAAYLLATAVDKIFVKNGALVIMELYPLLSAEQYAVPYPETILLDVVLEAGMSADIVRFPVRNGLANAYCIMAHPVNFDKAMSVEIWTGALKTAWERLESQALANYSNRRNIQSFGQYRDMLQQMTTIASIGAWRKGLWKTLAN